MFFLSQLSRLRADRASPASIVIMLPFLEIVRPAEGSVSALVAGLSFWLSAAEEGFFWGLSAGSVKKSLADLTVRMAPDS